MESALKHLEEEPAYFDPPSLPYAVPLNVVHRGGRVMVDNGLCRGPKSVWYFSGETPAREAPCKPNEVEVPRVVGNTLDDAKARLAAQPLHYDLIYRPAKPGERLDVVLGQMPGRGTLSAYDNVTLILAKPRFGIVPNVVGMPVSRAVQRLEQLKLQPAVVGGSQLGRVVRQKPRGGRVAAAPGLPIRLIASAG